ncbi:nucleoporin p58/p45-like isoform X2 [Haliotis rufescens]|uniref:nucleoporin p58/p45-like isoform X2 n=1 Tax=Haliotis rufescens TaxID=6454 RepID=UPI00201F6D04|nr:nucleoporin p58/p45-like isoform X2 [Haliotis rufescens]
MLGDGFNFGTTPAATTAATGIGFGQPAASGFGFGATAARTTATGVTLGTTTQATGGGFSLGGTVGFPGTLGGTTATTSAPSLGASGGFSLTVPGAATTTATVPALGGAGTSAAGGFSFGLGATTTTPATSTVAAPITGLGLGAAVGAAPAGGFSFGKPTSVAPTLGKPVGTLAVDAAPFNTSQKFGGGGLTTATTASTGLGLFGPTAAAATAAPASIFSAATTTAATVGLGGVDPKTSTASGGTSGTAGKTSDGKAVKETQMPAMLVETVTVFQKYVKEEKTVREDIARMSTKPMLKVQEDVAALKQLLSVVSNGLQRNACAVDKLKKEMAHELKNAEMAQRTKDIPPGLQYENTAPTIYFQQLVEEFEGRMITYRQQIETLENHLAALHQPTRHSPAELIALMKKLHETFIALAAQLHQVNEAVKTQKEHYLNYRKIFHGDTKNIFEKQQKAPVSITPARTLDPAGPTPFTGMTNAAAAAMASVLNRSQQPAGAPPVVGLSTSTLGGAASGLGTSALGTSGGLFGGAGLTSTTGLSGSAPQLSGLSSLLSSSTMATPAAIKPLGGLNSSIFSTPAAPATFASSTPLTAGVPPILGATPGQSTLSAGTNKPFQLQKPPQGAKRGKR